MFGPAGILCNNVPCSRARPKLVSMESVLCHPRVDLRMELSWGTRTGGSCGPFPSTFSLEFAGLRSHQSVISEAMTTMAGSIQPEIHRIGRGVFNTSTESAPSRLWRTRRDDRTIRRPAAPGHGQVGLQDEGGNRQGGGIRGDLWVVLDVGRSMKTFRLLR